ncbi:MAG: PilZ domain-containing protein [Thermoanaerobaculia bacterium]|nr:PilZ domain-containing protein [Thermoanaerobaculia bacterium]
MTENERRTSKRITFDEPVRGRVGGVAVSVLDIGLHGSKLAHQAAIPVGSTADFSFSWNGHTLEFSAKIVRCELQGFKDGKKVFHSGLDFVLLRGEAESHLRRIVLGAQPVDEPLVTADAPPPSWAPTPFLRFDDEEMLELVAAEEEIAERRRSAATPFIECRLGTDGRWTRTPVFDSGSPADGFTVPGSEDDRELDLLCRTYEAADAQTRVRIRASLEARTRGTG